MDYSDNLANLDERIAGFWRRFFAYITDLFIIQILYFVLLFVGFFAINLGMKDFGELPLDHLILTLAVPFFLIYFLLFITYFTTFFSIGGQTPGKMIYSIKVVSEDGSNISLSSSLLRSIGYLLSGLFLGLGFLMALLNKRRRALHDLLSGSYVIRTRISSVKTSPSLSGYLTCVLLSFFILSLWNISSGEIVDRIIAIVNNEVISLSDLKRRMALYSIIKNSADLEETKRKALEDLIDERLMLSEASRFGIDEPPEEEIKAEIKKIERDIGSPAGTNEKLLWYGLTLEDLNELSKSRLIIKKFIDQRINLFILISPDEVDRYLEENKEKFKGFSQKEARIKATKMLTDKRSREKFMEFKARLRAKANIKIITGG